MACNSCHGDKKEMPKPWQNPQVITSAFSGLLLAVGYLGFKLGLPDIYSTGIYIGSVIVGGYFFGREAFEELIKEREIGIELLMTVGALASGAMGEWAEAATLVFLYSMSEAAEGYTGQRARHAVRALMDLSPKTALLKRDGKEVQIPVEEVQVGDLFIVRPGESIPTDGEVAEGHSSVNQAPVTGESVPVEKIKGSKVFSATLNGEGVLFVRATRIYKENTISRIIELVEKAQASKGQSQRFIERFGKWYSPTVLGIGVLIAIVPGLLGFPWETFITRAIVFIVAASPCALVISVPITLVAAMGTAGRKGILIKGGIHLENLAKVKVAALDKTGTLTKGEPVVTEVVPLNGISLSELLEKAAALEARSQHPLAQAILKHTAKNKIHFQPAQGFQSLTGLGAKGQHNKEEIYIGSPALFQKFHPLESQVMASVKQLQEEGKTVVLVGTKDTVQGLIAISDPLRSESIEAVKKIQKAGIRVVMLTGDNEKAARTIGAQAGVDEVFSDLSPEDKTIKVEALDKSYGRVVMVGDGVNDAPALAAAHVGIAMGAAGTDVALETADVALMTDNLSKLPYLFQFSQRSWRIIQQNLVLSIAVISVLVVGAVGGFFTLPVAVLAHEISEFVVILSGLRMLKA